MDKINQKSESLIIKNVFIKKEEIIKVVGIGVLLIIAGDKLPDYWIILPIVIMAVYSYDFFRRLSDRKPQLIIDNNGIQFCKKGLFFLWKDIKYAEAKFHVSEKQTLFIAAKQKTMEINLTDYDCSFEEINDKIEYFSGKKIETYHDKFKKEVIKFLADKQNVDEVMKIFSKFQTRFTIFGLSLSFGLPAIAIYFQLNSSFPYIIAIGFILTVAIVFFYVKFDRNLFRHKEKIRELTDKEFEDLAILYQLKYKDNKKRKILAYIFFMIVSIGIFAISYFASK